MIYPLTTFCVRVFRLFSEKLTDKIIITSICVDIHLYIYTILLYYVIFIKSIFTHELNLRNTSQNRGVLRYKLTCQQDKSTRIT